MKFLLFGYGSIGRRRAAILRDLGHQVVTVDPYAPDADFASALSFGPGFEVRRPALRYEADQYDGVLDCTPPSARPCLRFRHPVMFIEKPPGRAAFDLPEDALVQFGFQYLYDPTLLRFADALADAVPVRLATFGGYDLRLWFPDADYRNLPAARLPDGGAVNASLPHSLAVADFLVGPLPPVPSYSRVGHVSGLSVPVEDYALVVLDARVPVVAEVDFLRAEPAFRVSVLTARGGELRWQYARDQSHTDAVYRRQMEAFVALAGDPCPANVGPAGIRRARRVQAVLDALDPRAGMRVEVSC